ncbi:hypothetical protein TU86_14935 [Pseudomonas weihenstephanensis]|uniref:Uncharacterized protein n=1 Tax=Pseudomonas weihenstephanensis TaxID=1608994 RepID=A0A0J6IM65_9PSED|nr:hypothetical protein TU86_14935 [Pseudomonas weihenstephanensis]
MAAHGIGDYAPYRQIIPLHYMKIRVTGVLRLENDALSPDAQTLADGIIIEQGHHDLTVERFNTTVNHCQIAGIDACTLHAVAIDRDQVYMRRANIQQLIHGDLLLNMVRCRRGKTSRNLERAKRQANATFRDWTQGCEAHDARL